jgi:hypothetical protein
MPPVALSGVSDGRLARNAGVTSQAVLVNVSLLNFAGRGVVSGVGHSACALGLNALA